MTAHLDGCPLRRPWLYDPDEGIECMCTEIAAEEESEEEMHRNCPLHQNGKECGVCGHDGCGWCPECHPEVPEWDL